MFACALYPRADGAGPPDPGAAVAQSRKHLRYAHKG